MVQHVFIVGSKGFGNYGGYETFVDKLTEYHSNEERIRYHVACREDNNAEFLHHGAIGFNVNTMNLGPFMAIYYDLKALDYSCKYVKKHHIEDPIVYVLACRVGPFFAHYRRKIHRLGGRLYLNPDGHEWKRGKWSKPIRAYWRISEKLMVKNADYVICDSKNIEKYILEEYGKYKPVTTFAAYGAEVGPSKMPDTDPLYLEWLGKYSVEKNGYYLIVGRFVPENNYETIVKEFMKSDSKRKLIVITTVNQPLLEKIEATLHFSKDARVVFADAVYNQALLAKIREGAFGYFHGHEVGGTNPSLLEALGYTNMNLLLDVNFNKEVGADAALYWTKEENNLAELINRTDGYSEEETAKWGERAKKRISTEYSWQHIADIYKDIFLA